ncbi:MAG: hypothetical protein QM529_06960 [Hydrotalea sp.]|nr:hypothetical protein [Hydrotalea sp.]
MTRTKHKAVNHKPTARQPATTPAVADEASNVAGNIIGSQSFKTLGIISVVVVGLCLLFYYLVGLYFWVTAKTTLDFQPAFYFLGIVLPVSGFVHVGSKFANRGD